MSETIGTFNELSYHRQLKYRLMSDPSFHEQKVGKYIADIRCGKEIIEIQSCSFYKLKSKLSYYLSEGFYVTIAYPIEAVKWLIWINPQSGELTRRRSPKKGQLSDLLPEMYGIREFVNHPNLSFLAILAETEEIRLLGGKGGNSKKRAKRLERRPITFLQEIRYSRPEDFHCFIPTDLPEYFTVQEYQKYSRLSRRNPLTAHHAVGALAALGLAVRDGNRGKAYLYHWNPSGKPFILT